MLGMFGMRGLGTSDGTAHTDSVTETVTNGTTHVQNGLETYQRIAGATSAVAPCILAVAGAMVGTILFPGLGTIAAGILGSSLGSGLGSALGGIVNGIGGAITGKNGFSDAVSTSISHTQGWADTTSHAISNQIGGGGFGSFGLTWTHTTTVGQTLLNRKAQYVEEMLKAYEDRLHEGMALGMWNLGHYFCASDESTYNQGIGVVTSLFSGMDSTYEPPRALKMPKEFGESLHRFNNVYLCFSPKEISTEDLQQGKQPFSNHPLGFIFNGPCTPVNTRELAIATPLAMEDIEGVTVSHRPAFGINLPTINNEEIKTLTLGNILDKGLDFLNNPKKGADRFRGKFDKFFMRTRSYTQNPTATITSVAYEQIFLRNQTIVTLNKTFDQIKNCDDSVKRLGIAIKKILPTLLPDEYEPEVSEKIVGAILKDVAPHITVTQVINI